MYMRLGKILHKDYKSNTTCIEIESAMGGLSKIATLRMLPTFSAHTFCTSHKVYM